MQVDGVHRLSPDDATAVARLVENAAAAGDLAGSSEPRVAPFLRYLGWQPRLVAVAWEHGDPVGLVSPELKALVVSPSSRGRGNGRRLVEAGLAIERERQRENLLLGPPPGSEAALAFLRACGFARHSTLWELALPPELPVAPPTWPEGVTARQYARAHDVRNLAALFNLAFADHPTPMKLDEETIVHFDDDPDIEDDDTLVLEDPSDGGALVGFCSTDPHRSAGVVGGDGEIWTIGVRPDRQGRGLGRQLLRWGVRRLRDLDVTRIALSVNGRNEHALRLYEDEGFAWSSTRDRWARPVDESPMPTTRSTS